MAEEGGATVPVVSADLIARAQAGDGDAFREVTGPYLRELQVHCYRMLGSFQDAEDALQDTLLAAWQGLGGFEGRASLRTWLYRIATNRCLNARRSASRRRAKEWNIPGVEPPEPTRLGEVVWLQPFPDTLLEGAIDVPLGPEARYEQNESISLAFVTALQVLPPRQLAVEDDGHAVRRLTLARDHLAVFEVEILGMLGQPADLLLRQVRQQRNAAQSQPQRLFARPSGLSSPLVHGMAPSSQSRAVVSALLPETRRAGQ